MIARRYSFYLTTTFRTAAAASSRARTSGETGATM